MAGSGGWHESRIGTEKRSRIRLIDFALPLLLYSLLPSLPFSLEEYTPTIVCATSYLCLRWAQFDLRGV